MKKLLLALLFILPMRCLAVQATVTNTFLAGQKIVASQVNRNFTDVLNAINGQLDNTNILSSVLTGGVSGNIATQTITNLNIASNTITFDRLSPRIFNLVASSSFATVNVTGDGGLHEIATSTITTTGRAVIIGMIPPTNARDFNGSGEITTNSSQNLVDYVVTEDGTRIAVGSLANALGDGDTFTVHACSSILTFSNPTAGSHTYKILIRANGTVNVSGCRIFTNEL